MVPEKQFWQQYPAVCEQVTARQIDAEKVILNLDSGHFFTLNEVGAFLWNSIDGHRNLEAIFEGMVGEYDVAEMTAREDLGQIVAELVKEKLIELRSQPSAEA